VEVTFQTIEHAAPRRLLRFSDLKARNIVRNWPTLLRWIKHEGFPPGFNLGPQSRAWDEAEVDAWLETRRVTVEVAQ
jgi:predicted DNA-binding transcriptional regulator AlpA